MKKDPKVATIVADAHAFDELRTNKGWKRLYEKVVSQKERYLLSLSQRMLGPKSARPTDEEIAYHQGWWMGALWVLEHPEHAERNLEQAARLAWLITNQEMDKIEEEDSPYV